MQMTFEAWLNNKKYKIKTIQSRISGLNRFEKIYGSVSIYINKNSISELLEDFKYTSEDKKGNMPNPSKIVIDGDYYTGLATIRQSINLYVKFYLQNNKV